MIFESELQISKLTWQAFERDICRLLLYEGFTSVRLVGQTGDNGADIIATRDTQMGKKRWLFQAKHWNKPVGENVVNDTIGSMKKYNADIPVIVSVRGFESSVKERQKALMLNGIHLQLWDSSDLVEHTKRLQDNLTNRKEPRTYQVNAIQEIVSAYLSRETNRVMVVMATGLGKTFVAAESIRRIRQNHSGRVLVCAHTNDLVYQLERSFWPFLKPTETTLIWNSYERVSYDTLERSDFTFACVDSVLQYIKMGNNLPDYSILLVDECHHAGSETYRRVFEELNAGKIGGPFAMGLTATPWRPDEVNLSDIFGEPRVSIDMITGMKQGFLTNVDYRMYTNNINWEALKNIKGQTFSPRQINRTLFINQWDDAVIEMLRNAWQEQSNPRAIVFCSTIEHAIFMRDRINAMGFCNAAAIYSNSGDKFESMSQYDRNKILSDFDDGRVNIVCAVDIFNEGIDVPDVNILVFQRVTHSRRIFIQQLGRGLRIAEDKDKVIVLDFVSDVRRFAAGIELSDSLKLREPGAKRISIGSKVTFMRADKEDPQAENFLRQWLKDVAAIEAAAEDASVLAYPPDLSNVPGDLK